ncbi:MAG: o-succinylbenzoate--CoA ligase [Haloarculaceae archaeon]
MSRTPVDWPTRDPLAHRTAATPDRTAVVDVPTGREWTYRGFDGVVADTARRLRSRLDDAGCPRVALLSSTRVESVAAVHAALRAGAAVVPLNTRLSDRELRAQLRTVDPALLVCESGTEPTALDTAGCPVLSLDTPETSAVDALWTVDAPGGESASDGTGEWPRWDRDETALLLFTSGTTGRPKCVRLTLGTLVASATAAAFRLGVSPGDRWLDCLPIYHVGGLAPLVRCALYGTTLLVATEFDATGTAEALATQRATGVSLVPTQLRRLLAADWQPPASLETVLLGGAPAPAALVERALDAGVPVSPTYGLTEAASQVATAPPSLAGDCPGSVGHPLLFTTVTVVDDDGSPLDAGETGELVVDGPTVTPGYLDPDRTAAAFGDAGLYTGDVGYRDADGRLWVLGRADDTIVTGGENVHPGEVESVLREHPDVDGAAVVGVPDAEWGERVGALVVGPDALEPADVRAFARDRLAGFKLPRTVAVGTALPRTASGTVDRQAVRDRLDTDREG